MVVACLSISIFFISSYQEKENYHIKNTSNQPPNSSSTQKNYTPKNFSEEHKLLPEEPFPPEEITIQFINSTYAVASKKTSGTFHTGQEADILISGIDFNRTGGPLLFNHPSGIATDGKHLFLVDTFNNRILIWNNLPTNNTPPDVVLGQKDFFSNAPGKGRDQLNWPFSIATDGTHLVVSDVNNARILIWNKIPTKNGTPADIVLEGGDTSWKITHKTKLPGASWGVWTNGEKLVVTNTWSDGTILIWNSFPTKDNQTPDIVLHIPEIGTPRHITSDGKHLIIGDHNAHVPNKPETGSFFWKEFPTSENSSYDFFMSKGFGWLRGTFIDGKLLLLGGEGSMLRIWNSFPENEDDEPDIELNLESAALFPDDYMSVAAAKNKIYISHGNNNRVIGYNSIPTKQNQEPDFVIGAPDIRTNTLKENFFIQNGVPASNGKSLFVVSDFDRKLYIWKNLPDESGAHPDIVYSLPTQPWDITINGSILALAGERTVYIWKELPLEGNKPDVILKDEICNIKFEELKGVAIDNNYFYLSDFSTGKVYIWEGIPDKDACPKFTLNVEKASRMDSNGKYLVISIPDKQIIEIYSVDNLSSNAKPISTIGGPGKLNLPQAAIVRNGMLFIADTSNNRVLVWNNVEEAISGKWPPDAVLGKSSLEDVQPKIGKSSLFFPAALSFDGSYLWVGEFKFSNRILRFSPS